MKQQLKWLRAALILIAASALTVLAASGSPVSRELIEKLERQIDRRIQQYNIDDPIVLLGATRGTYLQGYGVVFMVEVNLAPVAVTPFHPRMSKDQIERLRLKKLNRLKDLQEMLEDLLVASARQLHNLDPDERVAIAASLFHFSWENTEGLPRQLLVSARHRDLLKAHPSQDSGGGAQTSIEVTSFY